MYIPALVDSQGSVNDSAFSQNMPRPAARFWCWGDVALKKVDMHGVPNVAEISLTLSI